MDMGDILEHIFAGRWIAGTKLNDAIKSAQQFNAQGMKAIINYLGEEISDQHQVDQTMDMYVRVIRYIKNYNIKADISVKPTQLGLSITEAEALSNYSKLLKEARSSSVFVWLDMEGEHTVDSTIKMYLSEVQGGLTGICMQAYLKRTESDMQKLAKYGAIIRLVKGAYSASKSKSFTSHSEVTKNYAKLMQMEFEQFTEFTLATHDIEMIRKAQKLNETYKRKLTFAMLKGIRNGFAKELARDNRVSIYVPFGEQWVSYSYRRLKEAGHIKLVLKSLFENQGV
ncbi:MAG: proline dehydrogenase family protein [Candidatus Marsarchaeota archaeon]|nr:proline dehydrogenase family protein [Candidatus Marsarchaeota archaeon]MCL5101770.1 proline dehydrogenase family protein [Candidatus Marsarchaeota archaeon]